MVIRVFRVGVTCERRRKRERKREGGDVGETNRETERERVNLASVSGFLIIS